MNAEDTRSAYHEFHGRLRPFIAKRVPPADVDDVVQEVFLRVQRSLSDLEDDQSFAPWLYQVTRNAIADNHRQQRRQPALLPDDALEREDCADESGPSPLEVELAAYIVPFVSRLPSPYREALTLTELQGLTQQAAADVLGISLSGMKSRVQRGRAKLRELLDECCRIACDARGRVIECVPRQPTTCACKSSS
jgi:RNA polymerase sigma-70 factor (ECF subfamily)